MNCWSKVIPASAPWANASTPALAVFDGTNTSVVGLAIVGLMVVSASAADQDLYWNVLAPGTSAWAPLDNATAALCPTLTSALADVAIADVAIADNNPEG